MSRRNCTPNFKSGNRPGTLGCAKAQSQIFVYGDKIQDDPEYFNHVPGGGNVLYMDGHVEFIKYPGKFPFSALMATRTREIGDAWSGG